MNDNIFQMSNPISFLDEFLLFALPIYHQLKLIMRVFLFFLAVSFLIFSCEIDPNRKKKQKFNYIEDQVKKHTDSLGLVLDSLCDLHQKERFDFMVDSIIDVRLADIRRKIDQKK